MKCNCGFQFSGPGEFRNCEAFITKEGKSGIVCPDCGNAYVAGEDGWALLKKVNEND